MDPTDSPPPVLPDPVGDTVQALATHLRAERWLVALQTDRGWIAHGREPSHKDDLLLHLAVALSSGEGVFIYDTPELGHAGLRLQTSGVDRLMVIVSRTGPRASIIFIENPRSVAVDVFVDSDVAPALARMAASVRSTYDCMQRVSELKTIDRWMVTLGHLADGEIEEGEALQQLGQFGFASTFVVMRPALDHLDTAWATKDGTEWRTGSTRLRNAGSLKLDPPSDEQTNTIAKLLGVEAPTTWLIGRSHTGTVLAAGDAADGSESADILAGLLESAAGRGRDTTATRNNALLSERARIAGVIHEGITQVLTNVAIQMEVLDQVMDDPKAARKMVQAMRGAVLEALDSLRGAILELTPNAPEWTDLAGGLERFIGDFGAQWGLDLSYTIEGTPRDIDPDVLALVFAFVQEGLSNVRKHAGTEAAAVVLSFEDDVVRCAVGDEGKGFDPADRAQEGFRLHQGLQIVRSRVRLAGGKLEVQSTPGHGTTMLLEVVA